MALTITMEALQKLEPRSFITLVQSTIDQMGDTDDEVYFREMLSRLLKGYETVNSIRCATSIKTIATALEDLGDV